MGGMANEDYNGDELCERHAAAVLGAAGRLPSRAGLWVTVVVHERDGQGMACVSTCITPDELQTAGPVLSLFGAQLSATSSEPSVVPSPWAALDTVQDE